MRFKLNLLLFFLVTVIFAASSMFSYYSLRAELYQGFEERKQVLANRLQANLRTALWNLDRGQALGMIDAELGSADVLDVRVYHGAVKSGELWVSRSKTTSEIQTEDHDTFILPLPPPASVASALSRPYVKSLGELQINFTRQGVESLLAQQVHNRIVEGIILNAVLAMVLFVAISRKVIGPLGMLTNAFKELARNPRSGGINIRCEDEFAEVVVAFNQIERRLVADIESLVSAEKNLRASRDDLITAQSQLLQSEKMAAIGQLAAGVAHEINNPVSFVNSNLATLKIYAGRLLSLLAAYENGDAEEIKQTRQVADITFLRDDMPALINESQDGLKRVTRIVQDLKDYSRVNDAGRQLADLNESMESTLNVVWNELKYKAEVIRELGAIPMIDCFPAQINQVFTNLLVNAAQAITERGKIFIRSWQEDDVVCFEVEDTGQGMSEETQRCIFEPFFTTKPVGKGTGLGLSISYDIVVKKHGGQLQVTSECGKGTCFRVVLPVKFMGPTNEQASAES